MQQNAYEEIWAQAPKTINKAKINGKVVVIDLADENRNAYYGMTERIQYLGLGRYHSYNDVPADDKKLYHFWRFKEPKTPRNPKDKLAYLKETICKLNDNSKEKLCLWLMSETGRGRLYSKCVCYFRSRCYSKDGIHMCRQCNKPI